MSLSFAEIEQKVDKLPELDPIQPTTASRETINLWVGLVDQSLPPAFQHIIEDGANQGRPFVFLDRGGPPHPDVVTERNRLAYEMAKDGRLKLLQNLHRETSIRLRDQKIARKPNEKQLAIMGKAEKFFSDFFGIRQSPESTKEIKLS